ncbi:nitroalkane oxidase [Mesobacillus persicus]|uniref:Probable nitronate monooxygenase n=1 Tax=Mesobacillus persicus TaxID=930146 RepID=A0A1H8G6Z8_9BACI|nr:nitronate monooxygenase [Mesobacillus persicus]SEN39534.1 nitroalkane oxidase [Mesobacillus persicus]
MELASVRYPIIQAPMAGGVSNPTLASAVSNAGALGFLAGGYKSASQMREEILQMRKLTTQPFGVNVFVPGIDVVDTQAVANYAKLLKKTAQLLDVNVGEAKMDVDDEWEEKLEVLYEQRVPFVSFTFGCPSADVISRLRECGSCVMVTVTTPAEGILASDAGADVLVLQGIEAGGHRGSFLNSEEDDYSLATLLEVLQEEVRLPLVATGGIMHGLDISSLLEAGADAVQLGTAFLSCHESGANEVYKKALVDPQFDSTTVTRAFTGRRARGLTNAFILEHDSVAPAAYPHLHHMTKEIRKAAVDAKRPEFMSLWAGQRHELARDLPAARLVELLVKEAGFGW